MDCLLLEPGTAELEVAIDTFVDRLFLLPALGPVPLAALGDLLLCSIEEDLKSCSLYSINRIPYLFAPFHLSSCIDLDVIVADVIDYTYNSKFNKNYNHSFKAFADCL